MSGEINYRSFGQAKQVAPKYLSDQLSGYYGNWACYVAGAPSIAYDNLPPDGSVLARVYRSLNNDNAIGFDFNEFQFLRELQLDFYLKCSINGPAIYLDAANTPTASLAGAFVLTLLNAAGAAPTVWTKYSIKIQPWNAANNRTNYILARAKCLAFYTATSGTQPYTLEVAGMTVRRL